MPIEPPPSEWEFPDVSGIPGDLIGVGADLEPGTVLAAYRQGCFPMPDGGGGRELAWWSPQRRGVLPLSRFRATRSLRQTAKRMEIRVDTAFEEVLEGCADPAREGGWIDDGIKRSYLELHRLGWAHSVETWQEDRLVGGLYGVAIGGLFAGESMFRRVRDASKVALLGLVEIMCDEYADGRLLDVQWRTDHLASLVAVEVNRPLYLLMLSRTLALPTPEAFTRTPISMDYSPRPFPLGRVI